MEHEYVVIKAEENGVSIMGLTSGRDTRFHHTFLLRNLPKRQRL